MLNNANKGDSMLSGHEIGYLSAKLEEMHDDIRELSAHVDQLRQESTSRKAVQKFTMASIGVIATVVAWLIHTSLALVGKV